MRYGVQVENPARTQEASASPLGVANRVRIVRREVVAEDKVVGAPPADGLVARHTQGGELPAPGRGEADPERISAPGLLPLLR